MPEQNSMLVDDIALTLQPEIGPKTAIHLMECFGSAEALFSASAEQMIQKAELKKELAQELVRKKFHKQAEKELGFLKKYNVHALVSTSEEYPALLKECPDHPHVFYIQGNPGILRHPMIAFAGTRDPSAYGKKMCRELIAGLAELLPEAVIVSGLSYGIDAECHRTALDCNLTTLALLPNGLTSIYPSHNTDLAREIIRRDGAIMTEFHSGFIPHSMVFLQRNRIVAGLCSGTVMVECPPGSGSLTTAKFADEYDHCLMAVPGRVTDLNSKGTNHLIKTLKARMVCTAGDILRELNWEERIVPKPEAGSGQTNGKETPGLSKDEQGLLTYFNEHEIASMEELIEWSGLEPRNLIPLLFSLEMAGILTTLPGNRYQKV